MDPLDEYFTSKTAGFWEGASKDLRGAAIGVGVTMAAAAAVPAAQKIIGAVTKRYDFNQMLAHNPQLREHQAANPTQFNQMYSSLRSLNPAFAGDPLVAGGLMMRMVDEPSAAANILMDASRTYRAPSFSPMQEALVGGAQKGLSLKPPMKEQVDPYADQRRRVEGHELSVREEKALDQLQQYGKKLSP